ncbi:MAG: hypothetical protein M1834_002293 [Cirrosporium novae-zelandiae]|nr:MAG: hypothetical protein M1834_002293 [Cirrosporium novae-zelandiae]
MILTPTSIFFTLSSLAFLSRALPLAPRPLEAHQIQERKPIRYSVVAVDGGISTPAVETKTEIQTIETTEIIATTLPGETETVISTFLESDSVQAIVVTETATAVPYTITTISESSTPITTSSPFGGQPTIVQSYASGQVSTYYPFLNASSLAHESYPTSALSGFLIGRALPTGVATTSSLLPLPTLPSRESEDVNSTEVPTFTRTSKPIKRSHNLTGLFSSWNNTAAPMERADSTAELVSRAYSTDSSMKMRSFNFTAPLRAINSTKSERHAHPIKRAYSPTEPVKEVYSTGVPMKRASTLVVNWTPIMNSTEHVKRTANLTRNWDPIMTSNNNGLLRKSYNLTTRSWNSTKTYNIANY